MNKSDCYNRYLLLTIFHIVKFR